MTGCLVVVCERGEVENGGETVTVRGRWRGRKKRRERERGGLEGGKVRRGRKAGGREEDGWECASHRFKMVQENGWVNIIFSESCVAIHKPRIFPHTPLLLLLHLSPSPPSPNTCYRCQDMFISIHCILSRGECVIIQPLK